MAKTSETAKPSKRPRFPTSATYELCRELIDKGMPVTEAFVVIGERTGRASQTIHSAYYTHLRHLSGEAYPSRAKTRKGAPSKALRSVASQLRAVQKHIDAQDQRIRELESQTAQLRDEAKVLRGKAEKYDAMIAAGR
jgi:hypothetical protein